MAQRTWNNAKLTRGLLQGVFFVYTGHGVKRLPVKEIQRDPPQDFVLCNHHDYFSTERGASPGLPAKPTLPNAANTPDAGDVVQYDTALSKQHPPHSFLFALVEGR